MFRLKLAPRLILATMLIVTGVSAAILGVTQRSLKSAWRENFDARFLSQIESLTSLQKVRLESIQERCRELAKSDEVRRALESGAGNLPDDVLRQLLDRARVVRESAASFEGQNPFRRQPRDGTGPANRDPGSPPDNQGRPDRTAESPPAPQNGAAVPPSRRPDQAPPTADRPPSPDGPNRRGDGSRGRFRIGQPDFLDIALIDALGQIRSLKSAPGTDSQRQWLEKNKLKALPDTQQMGYLAADTPFRFRMPREVIISPIQDAPTGATIGALVVGLPMSTYGETAVYDLSRPGKPGELYTGLWIEDELFTLSIPRSARKSVSDAIAARLKNEGEASSDLVVTIDDKPHQLLFRSLNPDSATPDAYQITLYSLAGLAEQQRQLRAKVLGVAGLALASALLFSWLASRRLIRPVRALVAGTQEIRKGHYGTRVPVTSQDELATLATSFNEMAEGLAQRERYRNLLFQVSDDDIARQLIETACLGGERREITVLFCDIRDFTATTAGMPPEAVIDLLNEHMTALTEIVHRHHGVVDKFVGDLIMALFGAPKSYGDDAGHAAASALEMMTRRRELNGTTAHPTLHMGIGIASGMGVAGCMGAENRLNYTVLGEPVNLASRLCATAGPEQILLDPNTVARLGSRVRGHALPPCSLKGIPQPIAPFLLLGLSSGPPAPSHGIPDEPRLTAAS